MSNALPPPAHDSGYRGTLFLPRTEFPMRASLPRREPEWLARWDRMGLHRLQRESSVGRPLFVLHDGPPYANGNLHIGHALNKVLKDMVYRTQQMLGRDSRYVPGWDCHGLPIEWKVEEEFKAKGRAKDEVPVSELRSACREFARHWIGIQREEFLRLGVGGDWSDPYTTMAPEAEAAIAREFHVFVMNGSLYRGSKPVMWSSVEQTALADAEIEYYDRTSPTITVAFPVIQAGSAILEGASVLIWTTTPWTIPSNRAIAWLGSIDYGVYRVTAAPADNWAKPGDRVVLADSLAASVFAEARVESYEREGDAEGLGESVCAHPLRGAEGADGFWDYDVPLHEARFVTEETGTGLVHVAPSHGADDYELAVAKGITLTHNVDADCRFAPHVPFFAGEVIYRPNGKEGHANRVVSDRLREDGALFAQARLQHAYPHSWRSKAPLIFRNTLQWFISVDASLKDELGTDGASIRERALRSIDSRVRWVPAAGGRRMRNMIETRPDWVVSRQRAWGVPLACFMNRSTGELLRDRAVNARIVDAFRQEGADAWFRADAAERFLGSNRDPGEWEKDRRHSRCVVRNREARMRSSWKTRIPSCGRRRSISRAPTSTGDGSIPPCCRGAALGGAHRMTRWLTHGFVLDENGEKMSKSKGNIVAPQAVIRDYGADILRLWIASSDYAQDLRIGRGILKSNADSYRRLRNTLRFLLGNLADWDESERVERESMPALDRWGSCHRLAEMDEALRTAYEAFAFQRAFSMLFNFCTNDLSSFYLDIRKDVLYCACSRLPGAALQPHGA